LLVEGLLFYGYETTSIGKQESTDLLFASYENMYFGYTVLALGIAIPVELFLTIALCVDKTKAPVLPAGAIAFGISILIAAIIGVVMLSFSFCHEWSGYWAVSFLWGLLLEVFVIQTFYMAMRYFMIQLFPQAEVKEIKT